MSTNESSFFSLVPRDVWNIIIHYLDFKPLGKISLCSKSDLIDIWANLTRLPPYPRVNAHVPVSIALKSVKNLTHLDVSLASTGQSVDFDSTVHRLGTKLLSLTVRHSRHHNASFYLQSLPNLTFVLLSVYTRSPKSINPPHKDLYLFRSFLDMRERNITEPSELHWIAYNLTNLKRLALLNVSEPQRFLRHLTRLTSLEFLAVPGGLNECRLLSNMTWLKGLVIDLREKPQGGALAHMHDQLSKPKILLPRLNDDLIRQIPFFTTIWIKTEKVDGNITDAEYYAQSLNFEYAPTFLMSVLHQCVQSANIDTFNRMIEHLRQPQLNLEPWLPEDWLAKVPRLSLSPLTLAISHGYHDISLRLLDLGASISDQHLLPEALAKTAVAFANVDVLHALEKRGIKYPSYKCFPIDQWKVSQYYVAYLLARQGPKKFFSNFRTDLGNGFLALLVCCGSEGSFNHRTQSTYNSFVDEIISQCPTSVLLDPQTNSLSPLHMSKIASLYGSVPFLKIFESILKHHGPSALVAVFTRTDPSSGKASLGLHSILVTHVILNYLFNLPEMQDQVQTALVALLNSTYRNGGPTLLIELLIEIDTRKQCFKIEGETRLHQSRPPSYEPLLPLPEILKTALKHGEIDWNAQWLSYPADSLITLACKVGAFDVVANVLPHLSRAQIETVLPFSALPAAIEHGSAQIVERLINAGVRPCPVDYLPEAERKGKFCCLAALHRACLPRTHQDKRASFPENQTLAEIARLIVLNLPEHVSPNMDRHLTDIKGPVKEAINIAAAERRSLVYAEAKTGN